MANAKQYAWSISRLQTFEQCPLKYQHMNILKDVKDEQTEWMTFGTEVHKACELRLSTEKPLPKKFAHFEPVVGKVAAAGGKLYTEQQMALDHDMVPCDWFHPHTYVRGIVDVMRIKGDIAWVGDWKTGKMKDDDDQLKLFALMVFAHHDRVNTVKASYIWLKDMQLTSSVFTRDETPSLWADLLPRAKRIEQAVESDVWQPKTSGLCRFCPVGKAGKCPAYRG